MLGHDGGLLSRLPRCSLPLIWSMARIARMQSRLVWSMSVKLALVWNLSRSTKVSQSECWITLAVCSVDCRDAAYR